MGVKKSAALAVSATGAPADDVLEELKEKDEYGDHLGGIVFRREEDADGKTCGFIYIGNPYLDNPTVVRLRTAASEEDVRAVREEIIPMRESCEILEALAVTYLLGQPLLLEGPTAVGKTFLAEKFTELLYGRGVRPLEFYCTGQTDVSELTAKWVPHAPTDREKEAWQRFLDSPETMAEVAEIACRASALDAPVGGKMAFVHKQLRRLAEEAGFGEDTRWRLQYGCIPLALRGSPDGRGGIAPLSAAGEAAEAGFTLHVEEVGLAEPQVINVLLQLRGSRGRLADSFRLWECGGERVERGGRFWLVLSTNPPEEYHARNEIDPALARGVVFKRVGGLSEESLRLAARRIFSRRFHPPCGVQPGCLLDIYEHPRICEELAQLVAALHWELAEALRAGEKGRSQRVPLTLDDMARVSDYLLRVQVKDPLTGLLDLPETLERALGFYYLDRLADAELKERCRESFRLTLRESIGSKKHYDWVKGRERMMTRREILDSLVQEALLDDEGRRELRRRMRKDSERKKSEEKSRFAEDLKELLLELEAEGVPIREWLKEDEGEDDGFLEFDDPW